ncbi:MAG: dolichol kinase [Leptospiraceae bacterium]|nr:dolichol kinase [Leptospiraceae bacterium]
MDKFNFSRKLFHLIGFFVPIVMYFDLFKDVLGLAHASRAILFFIILLNLFLMGLIEILRLNIQSFNQFYVQNFGALMKEEEKKRMNGVVPYLISNAIIVAFFPPEVIFLSMAFLLIGDPVAAYFGANYGKFRFYNGKSLVGIVSFVLASIICGLILMLIFQNTHGHSLFSLYSKDSFNWFGFWIISIGALTSGLAEFFSGHALGGFLEDNLLIPVVGSITLSAFAVWLGLSTWKEIIFKITEIFL